MLLHHTYAYMQFFTNKHNHSLQSYWIICIHTECNTIPEFFGVQYVSHPIDMISHTAFTLMDRIGQRWTGLDRVGQDWTGLDRIMHQGDNMSKYNSNDGLGDSGHNFFVFNSHDTELLRYILYKQNTD
jgi:hypothetical protein